MRKIKKYFRVFLHFQKIGFMNRMQYRINFVVIIATVFIQIAINLAFIRVVFGFVNNISGWGYYQTLIVLASYLIIDGATWALTAYVNGIDSHVRMGTLDGIILKPINTQFIVSFWRGDTENLGELATGVGLAVYSLSHLKINTRILLENISAYVLLIILALVIIYSLSILVRSAVFWLMNSGGLFSIVMKITESSKYPIDIFFHKIVRGFFTFIIPLAFVATVPAEILTKGIDLKLIAMSVIMATLFFVVSRKFFNFALRHYSSASS